MDQYYIVFDDIIIGLQFVDQKYYFICHFCLFTNDVVSNVKIIIMNIDYIVINFPLRHDIKEKLTVKIMIDFSFFNMTL